MGEGYLGGTTPLLRIFIGQNLHGKRVFQLCLGPAPLLATALARVVHCAKHFYNLNIAFSVVSNSRILHLDVFSINHQKHLKKKDIF
jgi:hypothetical protein